VSYIQNQPIAALLLVMLIDVQCEVGRHNFSDRINDTTIQTE